ncbi:serine hydrolase [Aeoliella sp. SH292]|uniref:serine hydrolase n=1 Tax=Aeoliella sp. SH292 TaxID=3454464 RepID=UPI003F9719ED
MPSLLRTHFALALIGALLVGLAAAAKETATATKTTDELGKKLLPLIEQHRGQVGVMVKHLGTGETFAYREAEAMPTASLIKFPLLLAAYKDIDEGKVKLDTLIELKKDDQVPGSGILTAHFSPGMKLSLSDAMGLMISHSDNTATNLVIDSVGLDATNELMESLDCDETRLNSKVYKRDTSNNMERSQKYGLGSTSARDMVRLFEMLEKGEFLSKERSKEIIDRTAACLATSGIPRHLPAGTRVAHKTGAVGDTRTDAGIVYTPAGPVAIAVLTTANADNSWTNSNEAELLAAEIGIATYKHFVGDTEAQPVAVARELKLGSAGELVESLQRTLNERVKPAPGLGVDGDFGPATETAVLAFQKQSKLEPNGVVDRNFWVALGPLVTAEAAAPAAEKVVEANTKKEPAEPLTGPPVVTAKAWCFVDGETGTEIASANPRGKREPASTTKIMTAHLVLKLAAEKPEVLDQIVTFSKRADDTSGSSSNLRADEQLPVKELLYGLMLPSGNDASVALAEHFGEQITPNGEGSSYDRFIAAMNAEAQRLEMNDTGYRNPHGLPAEGHVTTAWDMTKLAREAMKNPMFRDIVSTRQRVYRVTSLAGYDRDVVWNNTNQLLKQEGYLGVKTGTTGAAGACLVACGERDGRETFGVILGSEGNQARYADMRNLFRYVWSLPTEKEAGLEARTFRPAVEQGNNEGQ